MAAFFGAAPPPALASFRHEEEEEQHQDAAEEVYHVDDVDEGSGDGRGHGGAGQGKLCARGHWRPAEDAKLKELVAQYGPQNWNLIAGEGPAVDPRVQLVEPPQAAALPCAVCPLFHQTRERQIEIETEKVRDTRKQAAGQQYPALRGRIFT